MNLNGTVRLFKDLGREEQAKELIQFYVGNRGQNPKFFDIREYPFKEELNDPDVLAAFDQKFKALHTKGDPKAILQKLAETKSWNDEDLKELSMVAVEDYYAIFKNTHGPELRRMIAAALFFDQISNASDPMKEISRRVREALKRIGLESAINARRVQRYGVGLR